MEELVIDSSVKAEVKDSSNGLVPLQHQGHYLESQRVAGGINRTKTEHSSELHV
jgi:hypothetical protein